MHGFIVPVVYARGQEAKVVAAVNEARLHQVHHSVVGSGSGIEGSFGAVFALEVTLI